MNPLRHGLPPLIPRIAALPRDDRGYPIPWFVAYVDGKPEFRVADARKHQLALKEKRCWVCGGKLGKQVAFVAGPMCGINRISAEPPLHRDCAEWSVQACPFLINPNMVRREGGLPEGTKEAGGIMLERNPGVSMVWHTTRYSYDPRHRLYGIGANPDAVLWYKEGRRATKAEVADAIESGFPNLSRLCNGPEDERDLAALRLSLEFYLPVK